MVRYGSGYLKFEDGGRHHELHARSQVAIRCIPRFWTFLHSLYARARLNGNLELSRSGNVRVGPVAPDGCGDIPGLIDNYYGNFIAVFGALFERALYDHKGHSHMENCSRVNRCGSCLPTTPAPARPSWRDF
jgi:hypothetical protein